MLGVSPLELAMIVVIGLVIFGPDRLPKYAADAAKFVRDLRRMASAARQDLTQALGDEMPDLDLGDLNPSSFLKGNVLNLLDEATAPPSGNGSSGNGSSNGGSSNGRTRGPRGASGGPVDPVAGTDDASRLDAADASAPQTDPRPTKPAGPRSYDADTT
jgi:sec-independent protein translocase protein TatB